MTARSSLCCEPVLDPDGVTYLRCNAPGYAVRLPCPAGRPDARGGPYCEEHGGVARADAEARGDWNFVAPESVGDAAAVARAGHRCLCSVHAYVVVRHLSESSGGVWLAWIGIGSLQEAVTNPEREANRSSRRSDGTRSFDSRAAAEARARLTWREVLDLDVRAITRARGGTLAWGVPVEPAAEPIVIVLEQGDIRSAWDVVATMPRRSRAGLCVFSGVRPSGEAA